MDDLTIINMTAHDVVFQSSNKAIVFNPSGTVIRLEEIIVDTNEYGIHTVQYRCDTLPPARWNTYYIVSYMVASQFPERRDFIYPIMNVRGSSKRVKACRGFGRVDHNM